MWRRIDRQCATTMGKEEHREGTPRHHFAVQPYEPLGWRWSGSTIVPELSRPGRRHQEHGVTDRSYRVPVDALLGTLRTPLGSSWTPGLDHAWIEAHPLIASVMKGAVQRASGATAGVAE